MKCFIILLNLALVIIGSTITSADDLSCPFNAKGTHPKCICNNDNPYDEVNRICATVLDAQYLLAKCPKGSEGTFPACICGDGQVYVPDRDACVTVDRTKCPLGSKKVNNKCVCDNVNDFKYELDEIFWICRPWYLPTTTPPPSPCPSHQHRVGNKCDWDHCPAGYESKTGYWPGCEALPTCAQKGMRGVYPDCTAIVIVQTCDAHQEGIPPNCHWLACPDAYITKTGYWPDCHAPPSCNDFGMHGLYPDCHPPPPTCPPYHSIKDGHCVKIPCPPGHIGDYQPNCKLVPKCPNSHPGKWPNCNIYATTPHDNVITTSTVPTRSTKSTTPSGRTTPSTKWTTPTSGTTPVSTQSTKWTTSSTPFRTSTVTEPISTMELTTPRTPSTPSRRTTPTAPTTATKWTTPTSGSTPKSGKCYCDCYSDEIVIFRDNVVRDPSRKYKRLVNERHLKKN